MPTPFGLDRLLAPHAPAAFFADHYEAVPLRIDRDAPGYYDDLLTVANLDAYLQNQTLAHPHVKVAKAGEKVPVEDWQVVEKHRLTGTADNRRLFDLMHDGHTLILNGLQAALPSLAAFAHQLEAEWRIRVFTNVYLTPAHAQGFGLHYDPHDVFVLQIAGSKAWEVYEALEDLPVEGGHQAAREPALVEAFTLEPGDLLYLPRGVYHQAMTGDDASVHITLGLQAPRAFDLLHGLATVAKSRPEFRVSIPSPYSSPEEVAAFEATFADDLRVLLDRVGVGGLRAAVDRPFDGQVSPRLAGRLSDALTVHTLGSGSRVQRRPALLAEVTSEGRTAHVRHHGRSLRFPGFLAPTLERALSGEPVAVAALAGPLDEAGAVDLARTLVREGLLRILPDAAF